MQHAAIKETETHSVVSERLQRSAAVISTLLLCAVPLTFHTAVHRFYTLPRFVLLVTGAAILAATLALIFAASVHSAQQLRTRQVLLLALYVLWIALSTIFGAAPVVSFFGSFENQMGLVTYFCFFVCSLALIVGVGRSRARFEMALWAMVLTALVAAVYGVAQFSGFDPFISPDLYTTKSGGASLIRIPSTIGHADYFGNFLLYTVWVGLALSIVSVARARRIALAAFLLIATAIVCSGTRGAWVGLVAGAIAFAFLEGKTALSGLRSGKRWMAIAATAFILAATFYLLIISNPASQNIVLRAKSFMADRLTGSGRTLLWRDSIKMIPAFAIKGCGPEGFRKAFLPYKSKELAQLSPQTNNESSHNAYLDAAISYGLPGLALYLGVIASTLQLMRRARRRAARKDFRIVISGLLASYTAVIAHNFFIFDQIPTGLYFFAFAALAQVASNIAAGEPYKEAEKNTARALKSNAARWPLGVTAAAGSLLTCAAIWYSVGLMKADLEIKQALGAAEAGNMAKAMRLGERATLAGDPTRAYDFLFAQAIVVSVDRMTAKGEADPASSARSQALEAAAFHASRSLARTLTPDSNYLLLAYISKLAGKTADLEAFVAKAMEWDPGFANTRWLAAQAYLARGLYDEAASQAAAGLELNPFSRELKQALIKAQRAALPKDELVKRYLKHGEAAAAGGNIKKAERVITLALHLSGAPCPDCHRILALAYEKAGRYDEAIAQYRAYMEESSSTANPAAAPHLKELMEKRAGSSETVKQSVR